MTKKKILLLTLGTGTINPDNGIPKYIQSTYEINGNKYADGRKTSFVAEPIITHMNLILSISSERSNRAGLLCMHR